MEVFCCQMVVGLVIFSADMNPVPADNKKKDILIFGEDPTNDLVETTMSAEEEYTINFTEQQNKFCFKFAS